MSRELLETEANKTSRELPGTSRVWRSLERPLKRDQLGRKRSAMEMPGKGQPKYLQIAADVRRSIGSGDYGPGSRLPGENDLMATYQVARETARKALAQLINEGIDTPRRGAGVYGREFRPVIRDGIGRLSGQTWPEGKPIWGPESEGRTLEVDRIQVGEDDPPPRAALLLGLADG